MKNFKNIFSFNLLLPGMFLAVAVFGSCDKDDSDDIHKKEVSDANIAEHIMSFDQQIVVESGNYHISNSTYHYDYTFPSVSHYFDVHMDILPLYLYGDNNYSGDYYAVDGYIVAHNDVLNYGERKETIKDLTYISWNSPYMKKLTMAFSLLDEKGNDLIEGDAEFYGDPQPQTTIGSTTYTTGYDISLSFTGTFGAQKDPDKGWQPTAYLTFPPLIPNITYKEQSVRDIPDQSVEHNVDLKTRTIVDDLITNNDNTTDPSKLPPHTRTDQVFHFSWVWHLNKGHRSSYDNSTECMKIRCELNPLYRIVGDVVCKSINGDIIYNSDYDETYRTLTDQESRTVVFTMPVPNRKPIGSFDFANASFNYVTNVVFANVLDTSQKNSPYCMLDRSEHYTTSLPEGTYRMEYDIVSGEDGSRIGRFAIDDIIIKRGEKFETSTLKGKKIQ